MNDVVSRVGERCASNGCPDPGGPWGQALGAMGTGLGDNGDSAQRGTLGTGLEALGTGPVRRVTALRTTTIVENRGRITSVFYNLQ